MKKLLDKTLAVLAKAILKKYRPKIIGITGSMGKTSAKEAVFTVLKDKFNVRQNIKNYNTEIGLPLTIIGAKSGGKNFFKWLSVFGRALFLLIIKDQKYPSVLILEMGADHPGDIQHLVKIAPCDLAIVTSIGPTHLEFFGSVENVKKEKENIVAHQKPTAVAILNFDDELVMAMKKKTLAKVITVGFGDGADIRVTDTSFGLDEKTKKPYLTFKLHHAGSLVPVKLTKCLAATHVYSFLFAVAIGTEMGFSTLAMIELLKDFQPPRGRMNLLSGIKHTELIDDTYNSSPSAALAALAVLSKMTAKRKIAVLGDMLELGAETETEHQTVGRKVAELNLDLLLAVGERARNFIVGALALGFDKNKIFHFDNVSAAGQFLQDKMEPGDLVLIKGSQGARMEKIVKEVMAEPERAKELLVRQDEEWMRK
ncbi:MAG: UDP-N-acetylmuramoyl-tripeptide--D-alanyl-D-alanine ligase [Patescibacteria group bacterium]|nr:UDP-N-acetylmuramoyl-tripeptide--D-alanyl-D-alanine ligase [Patescibacteria group bacterium]